MRRVCVCLLVNSCLSVFSISCSIKVEGFSLYDAQAGRDVPLFLSSGEGFREPGEVSLVPGREVAFLFERPVQAAGGFSLFVRYRGAGPGVRVAALGQGGEMSVSSLLPEAFGGEAGFYLRLPAAFFSGFAFFWPVGGEAGHKGGEVSFTIVGAEMRPYRGRFSAGPGGFEASSEIWPLALAPGGGRLVISPAPVEGTAGGAGSLDAAGRLDGASRAGTEVSFVLSFGTRERPYGGRSPRLGLFRRQETGGGPRMVESFRVELSARPVPERFFFHSRLLGFSAEGCEISGLEGGASWEVEVLSRPDWAHASPDFVPIPIDMGLLLESLPYWRHPDFEVFRWSLFPEILVFDSRTYAVQSRLFHRLAFFAEKRGFRGRLYADSHIAGRHGWNAHNYSARGLADFFETARATSFSLNSEERWLEGYLLAQGVIRREGGAIVAGRGGVLGISRESSPSSRSMLLTHEAFHGVFYGLPEYRRLVEDTWAALPDEQRDFWNFFFTWMGYDVTDLYLLVNEFQAYLLQQGVSQADAYYKGVIASRLAESRPERKVWLERLFAAEPDMFTRPARIFSAYLERAVGIRAGNVRSVQPISR